MNPYALESLYQRLGQPAWFWPVVMAALCALIVVGSSVAP